MVKKIRNIFYLGSFIFFLVLIGNFYFSEQNIILVNKSKSFDSKNTLNKLQNLPLLKNDTSDIIEYKSDLEIYKKNKKKYTFWDLIKEK